MRTPPLGPISFTFMQFAGGGGNRPNSRFTPRRLEVALGVGAPSSGKFWIRRCIHHIFRRKLLIMGTCMYIKSILNNKKVVHFKFQ